jgi:hypothetical protein
LTEIRPFVDAFARLESDQEAEGINEYLRRALPGKEALQEAIVRLVVEYPRHLDPLIDEAALREYASQAFEFRLVKRPQMESRIRLPEDQTLSSLSALELLEKYWLANHVEADEIQALSELAARVIEKPEEEVADDPA